MQPSRWGYFITIIGAGITPGSAWLLAGTGGRSAVTPEDVAAALDVLASRVRQLPAPMRAGNPDRFYEEQSEIAHDLAKLARRIAPRGVRPEAVEVDISEGRRGRIVAAAQTINGRPVMIQKRYAVAVFVGEGPVKKQ